jgi:hypothetical protein
MLLVSLDIADAYTVLLEQMIKVLSYLLRKNI